MSEKEAFRATDLMNNRPRKCLGYKTPFEVFAKMTMEVLHLWVEFALELIQTKTKIMLISSKSPGTTQQLRLIRH